METWPNVVGVSYFRVMRAPFRYVLYIVIGFLIYQIIDSGETGFTHSEVKTTLIIGMVIVFILLLIVRIIKNRYDNRGEE